MGILYLGRSLAWLERGNWHTQISTLVAFESYNRCIINSRFISVVVMILKPPKIYFRFHLIALMLDHGASRCIFHSPVSCFS